MTSCLYLRMVIMLSTLLMAFAFAQEAPSNTPEIQAEQTPQQDNASDSRDAAQPSSNADFTFAVIADTQAFRLMSGGDPNKESVNGPAWRAITARLVTALNHIPNISFGIINGDITEFGRIDSWQNVFSALRVYFPYYFGLGNHDYQNNVNDCRTGTYAPSPDSCAFNSVRFMERALNTYASQLTMFSRDWRLGGNDTKGHGSLSYSWDHQGVHFVQLQNFPSYEVSLTAWTGAYAGITSSVSWLREDLRLARLRGITDIIINFHQDDDAFPHWIQSYPRRQFRAILDTYRPLVIFTGHRHAFGRRVYTNDPIFGNVTVFRPGAAFDAQAMIVRYTRGRLHIQRIDGRSGGPVVVSTFDHGPSPSWSICRTANTPGSAGSIYVTPFVPGGYWNIRQVLRSGNNLDADARGNAYMLPWNTNVFQTWTLEPVSGANVAEFNSWYIIKQQATGRVLDADGRGRVYTNFPNNNNHFQQWRLIKTERGEFQLRQRSTGRFLDGNGSALYTSEGHMDFNQWRIWALVRGQNSEVRNRAPEAHFFRARTDNAYLTPFPQPPNSNASWEYLSMFNFLHASPCNAW